MFARSMLTLVTVSAFLPACDEPKRDLVPRQTPTQATAPVPTTESASTDPAPSHADAAAEPTAELDAGPPVFDGPLIGALFMQTPVMSDMEWPTDKKRDPSKPPVMRIGYLRQGAKVPILPEQHVRSNCKEGWYELVHGGFICAKYASLDLNHPKIKLAAHPPFMDAPLPYQYGYNVRNGTPLYRTIPSRQERVELEPWLVKKPKPKPVESAAATIDAVDPSVALNLTRSVGVEPTLGSDDALDAGVPWYLRDYDGGKPQVTLDDLRGEGPVERRMVKGFYLALDSDFKANGNRWWKTTGGLIAPFERIYVNDTSSQFHGVWLDENHPDPNVDPDAGAPVARTPIEGLCMPGSKAQVGIVLHYKAFKYDVTPSKVAAVKGEPLARHTVVRLTGESARINGAIYKATDEGFWIRSSDVTQTNPGSPPADLATGEKWIDVNLTTQTLVAFEGDRPVFATAVSTGRKDESDPEKDHRTPTGTFRIREKHIAATMDGDVASDGPYSIEDVPWIMYYSGSYALHGAFWHNNFGRTKSHGCTNLAPRDAKALFGWTEPRLPEGWHGVWSTTDHPGTRVVVHE